jgi:putative transport protein
MSWFVEALRHNPELAIFLTLALGFLIGRVRIGGFSFGTVVGTLLAGVLVGQLNVQVPAIVRYVLRMNPLILLGACAGAGTITAALRALQEESGSKVPAIGYTVPYAIGNILLTAWGPVLVALMSIGR